MCCMEHASRVICEAEEAAMDNRCDIIGGAYINGGLVEERRKPPWSRSATLFV